MQVRYRHAVLDGNDLIAITEDQDDAIRIAHDHELMQLHLHNRLTLCDILSRPYRVIDEVRQ